MTQRLFWNLGQKSEEEMDWLLNKRVYIRHDPKGIKMKTTDCCGVEPLSNGDNDTIDLGICPECGEHCEYIENNEDEND